MESPPFSKFKKISSEWCPALTRWTTIPVFPSRVKNVIVKLMPVPDAHFAYKHCGRRWVKTKNLIHEIKERGTGGPFALPGGCQAGRGHLHVGASHDFPSPISWPRPLSLTCRDTVPYFYSAIHGLSSPYIPGSPLVIRQTCMIFSNLLFPKCKTQNLVSSLVFVIHIQQQFRSSSLQEEFGECPCLFWEAFVPRQGLEYCLIIVLSYRFLGELPRPIINLGKLSPQHLDHFNLLTKGILVKLYICPFADTRHPDLVSSKPSPYPESNHTQESKEIFFLTPEGDF